MIAGDNAIVILVTAGNASEAQRIADGLIEGRLTDCVSIVPDVFSRYHWGGKVEESHEILLIVKSHASLLDDIITLVKLRHSYDVPEIIALPVVGGNEDYLEWLRHETHP